MASFLSVSKVSELKTSRSGRLLIPRLKTWTGERVLVTKGGVTEITEGVYADFTTTFKSERAVMKELPSFNVTQNVRSPPKVALSKETSKVARKPAAVKIAKRVREKKIAEIPKAPPTQFVKAAVATPKRRKRKRPPVSSTEGAAIEDQRPARQVRVRRPIELPMEPPPPPPSPPSPQPQPPSVNIWGPEFQPVVLLQRLTVEEVKTLTRSEAVQTPPRKTRRARSPARPPPTVRPEAAGLVDRKQTKKTTARPQRPLFRRKATVRETQQLLRQAHHRPVGPPVDEDQAAFTEGAFLNSSLSAGIKRLATAVGILNDDFGESDDNLSFRSISERESSPVSMAVSPVGSIGGDTDGDDSAAENALLRGSPVTVDPSSYHRARLVHRTMKDRATLQKKLQRKIGRLTGPDADAQREEEEEEEEPVHRQGTSTSASQNVCPQLYQPQMMRAFEKKVKKKVKTGSPWDFSAFHKGTMLHVSINSDSDEASESSFNSLEGEF